MMMNLLALCLVVTSLAAAGVWSPSPASHKDHDHDHDSTVIVREGHRVVVVEYDENGQHNTKVSISSDEDDHHRVSSGSAKERFKEASSVLPNLGQGLSYSDPEPQRHDDRSRSAGELICDAYGKCKHRIANAFGIAKDKTEDLQQDGADELAKDGVGDAVHKAKDTARDKAYDAKDAVGDAVHKAKDAAKDKAYDAKDAVGDAVRKAKDAAKLRAYDAKEAVDNTVHKAKDAAKLRAYDAKAGVGHAVHMAKDAAKDKAYDAKDAVGDAVHKAKDAAKLRAYDAKEAVDNAVHKAKDAAKLRAYDAKEAVYEPQRNVYEDSHHSRSPGELICDAYGKCKHRIANAFGIAKDKTEDLQEVADGNAVHQAKDAAQDRAYDAKDVGVGDAVHKAKDAAKDKANDAKEAVVHKTIDAAKLRAYEAKEAVGNAVHKVKDAAKDRDAGKAKDGVEYLKQGAVSTGKTAGEHVISNATLLSEKAGQWMQGEKLNYMMSIVNFLGFATAFGMWVWISFISSSLLASSMPKHMFGVVQSKVYPAYFKAMGCSIGVALLGHLFGQRKRLLNPAEMYQAWNLLVSLLLVNINLFLIEPRATKVMFERMKIEKEEGRGEGETQTPAISRAVEAQPVLDPAVTAATACTSVPTPFPERAEDDIIRARADGLNSKLKRFNSCSSLLNLFTFIGLNWHLVYLSQHLHSC